MSLFFQAKLSCNIFTFILKNSIKALELKKKKKKHQIRLLLNHSSKTISLLQLSKPWCLSFNHPHPQYFHLGGYSSVFFNQAPPSISQLGRGRHTIPHQIKLRIINQYRRSKNQERLTEIHVDSLRMQVGIRSFGSYQSSRSS